MSDIKTSWWSWWLYKEFLYKANVGVAVQTVHDQGFLEGGFQYSDARKASTKI